MVIGQTLNGLLGDEVDDFEERGVGENGENFQWQCVHVSADALPNISLVGSWTSGTSSVKQEDHLKGFF